MSIFAFSIKPYALTLNWKGQDVSLTLSSGLNAVTDGLASSGQLTAYDVEMMIYRVEEIIESDRAVQPVRGDAESQDGLLHQLSQRYFNGESVMTSSVVEASFSKLADALSYAALPVTPDVMREIAYLVFIREMMHHLAIEQVMASPGGA